MARVSLFTGYSTRMESRVKRKELISRCPQSNVRRRCWCIRPVATTAKFSIAGANSSGVASVGVVHSSTGVWGGFFPSGTW